MIQLNSLDRFDIKYNYDTSSYEFSTDDEVNYIITFLEYSNVIGVNFPFYSFIIDRYPENKRSANNNKIRNTILHILNLFFENNQSALVAIYDSIDGRQMHRRRLFNMWYNQFNDGTVSKEEGKFTSGGHETYAIVMYSNKHDNIALIKSKFHYLLDKEFFN